MRVFHRGASALQKARTIENFYGSEKVSGEALYSRGIKQAEKAGAEAVFSEVASCSFDGEWFYTYTADGQTRSRRLIIATGAARKTADIDGLKRLEGRGVSYCAVCDAFFYRKKDVCVLGAGEFAKHEFDTLSKVANSVTLLTNGEQPSFSVGSAVKKKIAKILGDERISGVEFDDGTVLKTDGLFVALGVLSSVAVAKSMGAFTDERGNIKTDERGMTNITGLYAAGDCTAGTRQIAKAACDGMRAAIDIISDFNRK